MNEKDLQNFATAFAQGIPPHLGKPTAPPLSWRVEGDQLRIILADGRGPFRCRIPEENTPGHMPPEKKGSKLIALLSHPTELPPEETLPTAGSAKNIDAGSTKVPVTSGKPPAKHKAGK